MRVRIEASNLPGRTFCADGPDSPQREIFVGVQRRQEVVEQVGGDSLSASWTVDVDVKPDVDGRPDVGGPFVHGKRGDRFLYLSWGAAGDDDGITMFRRAKLHFNDIDDAVLRRAADGAGLVARVGLTDGRGEPRCARVRPPDVSWSAG